jgi:DNA-binding PadR family transcriptional regulator
MPDRITRQLLLLLAVIAREPTRSWYGLELMEGARLKSGTLYPLLHRLTADGWLQRVGSAPSEAGGPGRRLYRLTASGERAATELLGSRRAGRQAEIAGTTRGQRGPSRPAVRHERGPTLA